MFTSCDPCNFVFLPFLFMFHTLGKASLWLGGMWLSISLSIFIYPLDLTWDCMVCGGFVGKQRFGNYLWFSLCI